MAAAGVCSAAVTWLTAKQKPLGPTIPVLVFLLQVKMASSGSGYDLSSSTFSPDGRIFQIEYASKAVENAGTALGLRCADGIVLAVEKPLPSKMMLSSSSRRIHTVDTHSGVAFTGFVSDARQIMNRAREEAASYYSK